MADVKITKAIKLMAVRAMVEGIADTDVVAVVDGVEVTAADILDYVDVTLAQAEAKAAKAKERAAEKKAESDELTEEIFSHITEEFQGADAITELVTGEDVTKSKVVSRLTKLVNAGRIVKEQVKIGDSKRMAYKLPDAVDAE